MFVINFASEFEQYCKKLWPKDNTEANVLDEEGRSIYTSTSILKFSVALSAEIIKSYSTPEAAAMIMKMIEEKEKSIPIGRLSNGFVVNYDIKKNKFFTNSREEIIFIKK